MSDEEDYGFEYSDEEEEEKNIEIENEYYIAKGSPLLLLFSSSISIIHKKNKHKAKGN